MVLFDPRSNARLAYRPAGADVPRTHPPHRRHTTAGAANLSLRRSLPRSNYQGDVRALHTSLHLPFPAGTSRPRALAAVVFATLWPKASSSAVSSSQSNTDLYFPIQTTKKPSSCAKSGTVALNAPSSCTLHSSTRAFKRNRPTRYQGPWAASSIVIDVLNGNTAHESQACFPGRCPPTRNGQSPLDHYRPRSSHVIQTPSRRRVYRWCRHSNAVSSAAIDSSNNF